jgi:hypothetical protein
MGNNVAKGLKPEQRELREHTALIGNRSRKHDVESGKPVRGNQEQIISHFIEVADLPAGQELEPGKICFPNNSAHVRRCHE